MKKLLIISAIAAMAANPAYSFKAEIGLGYGFLRTDANDGSEITMDTVGFYGNYYFKDVDTFNGPFREAVFLNRVSNIGISYRFLQQKISEDGFLYDRKYGIGTGAIDFHIVVGSSFIIEGQYSKTRVGVKNASFKTNYFQFGLGGYLSNGGKFVVSAITATTDFPFDENNKGTETFGSKADVHYYLPFSDDNGLAFDINIDVFVNDMEDEDSISTGLAVAVDYYFNPKLSIGGFVHYKLEAWNNDYDDHEEIYKRSTVASRIQYFFIKQISVLAMIGYKKDKTSIDNSDTKDIETQSVSFNLGLTARF